MAVIGRNPSLVNTIEMMRTNAGHLDSDGRMTGSVSSAGEGGNRFGMMVADAIGRVSDQQLAADEIFQQMVTNPDSVEPHDVTIAMAKAEMSLNLTKTVIDRAVKAYNDITSMR